MRALNKNHRMLPDFRETLRLSGDGDEQPSATILDGRTLPSTPGSGGRAGYDGAKKKNGTGIHMAVDTAGRSITKPGKASSSCREDGWWSAASDGCPGSGDWREIANDSRMYLQGSPSLLLPVSCSKTS